MFRSKPTLCPTTNRALERAESNCSNISDKGTPACWANSVDIPCIRSESKGISKPSGCTKKSWCSTSWPFSSCNCQAICIHRGQLSVSEMGASQRLGSPVVSVSNMIYIQTKLLKINRIAQAKAPQNGNLLTAIVPPREVMHNGHCSRLLHDHGTR